MNERNGTIKMMITAPDVDKLFPAGYEVNNKKQNHKVIIKAAEIDDLTVYLTEFMVDIKAFFEIQDNPSVHRMLTTFKMPQKVSPVIKRYKDKYGWEYDCYPADVNPFQFRKFFKSNNFTHIDLGEITLSFGGYGVHSIYITVYFNKKDHDRFIQFLYAKGFIYKVIDNFFTEQYCNSLKEIPEDCCMRPPAETIRNVEIPKKYKKRIELFASSQYNTYGYNIQYLEPIENYVRINDDFYLKTNSLRTLLECAGITKDTEFAMIYHGVISQKHAVNNLIYDKVDLYTKGGDDEPMLNCVSFIMVSTGLIGYAKKNHLDIIEDMPTFLTEGFIFYFYEEGIDFHFDTVAKKKEFLSKLPPETYIAYA